MPRMAGHNTFFFSPLWLNFKSVKRNCMTCIWPACIRIRLLLALMWDRNSSVRWDVRFEDGNNQWGWRSWLESQYLHKVFPFSCSKPHLLLGVAMPALAANFRSDVSRKSPPGQKLTSSVALRSDLRLLKQLASPEEALQSWRSGHKYQLEEVI